MAEFITAHLLRRVPRHYHGPLNRISLSEEIQEDNLHALFSRHGSISGVFQGRDGVLRYLHNLDARSATAVLESGATILFQKGEPFVRSLAHELPRELGFPYSLLASSAFLDLAGGGSPWHCDTFDNFVIQVTGEKRWRLAPNHQGQYATHNIWPPADESLATAPEIEPEDVQVVTLRPGSVLFLPRNYWHRTEALTGPCFSVTVGITRPTQLALILSILHEQLGDVPELIEPAGPLLSGYGIEAATVERLAQCVAELGRRLPRIDLAEAAQQSLEDGYLRMRFRVAEGISYAWETDASGERVLSVTRGDTHLTDLALDDADLAAIVPVVLQRTDAFTVRELQAVPAVDGSVLLGTLQQLVSVGILRCESADRGRNHRNIKEYM